MVTGGEIGIVPFQATNIRPASYVFTLGTKLRIPKTVSVVSVETGIAYDEVEIPADGYILQPNQFVLGFTREALTLNGKFACLLNARASCAQVGLDTLLSSTLAEPDTDGIMIIEMHNASASPILLTPGMGIAKGVFYRLE